MVKRRIIRKSSAVDSLLYSSRNAEPVMEQTFEIDDMFKQLMNLYKEYNSLLPLEDQEDDAKRFEDIDADMLVYMQKIHNWIRKAEQERDAELKEKASVKSKRSSKSSSKSSSSRLSSTRPSRSERALMEKLKMAELKAEVEFMEKSQSAEFQGHKLKIEEQYAKSQARMRILEDLQNPEVISGETNPYIYHNEDSKLVNLSYQESMKQIYSWDGCITLQ